MKKLLVKAELIDIPYSPAIEAVEAVEYQPEKWVKGEEVLFEEPSDLTDYTYHPAIEAVEGVEGKPEQLEVKSIHLLDQTQGNDDELAVWLAGNTHKYPSNYFVEYVDISAEIEQQAKLQQAMDEISKGIKGIAVFKVKVKEKGLSGSQISQLFASDEIKKITDLRILL